MFRPTVTWKTTSNYFFLKCSCSLIYATFYAYFLTSDYVRFVVYIRTVSYYPNLSYCMLQAIIPKDLRFSHYISNISFTTEKLYPENSFPFPTITYFRWLREKNKEQALACNSNKRLNL